MFRLVRKAFITIEYAQLKELFGFNETNTANFTEAAITTFLSKRGLSVDGSYVQIPNRIRGIDDSDSGVHKFHLSESRIQDLTQVVQFLEKKKIKFD